MKVLAALLFLLLVAAGPFDPFGEAGIDARVGAAVPMQAPLVDQDGGTVTLAGVAEGRPLLLVPVLHQCPNLCGVTLAGLVGAVRGQSRVAGRDFVIVAFGIDPREGPDAARADLARLAAAEGGRSDVPVVAVTGSQAAVAAVTRAIGYRYAWDARMGQYAHAAATALVTPDGHLSSWLYGVQPAPADLSRGLDVAGRNAGGSLMEQLILLCYHFDPATGAYSLLIGRIVRAAGVVTIVLLALLVLRLSRRRTAA